ncbi:MAG: hypothetical protein VXX50_05085 [Candidatus Thermoplasmatota archaeon]|nr:hypothetical protein [Candidatus Thermoplasmatota archaeon]
MAGSPISHSLTPVLSLLVDFHLNQDGHRSIVETSRFETKDISELLGQIVLGGNLGSKEPTNRILDLVQSATEDITTFPEGWGVTALDLDEYPEVESPFGDSPLVWVSLTTPLKHGLTSRSGVISSDRSLEIASTNQVRWDGHHLVTGSTDGLGVVLVARSFGLFSNSTPPLLILRGGGAAARSVAEAWAKEGGKIYSVTGRRPLDERGPWKTALLSSLDGSNLSSKLYIDFDSGLDGNRDNQSPIQVDIHLTPSYNDLGSVYPVQGSTGTLHLDGRWMLAAQHLIAWAIFIEPTRRKHLPSLPLLLHRLSDVEHNLTIDKS